MHGAALWVVDEAHRAEREASQARFREVMPDIEVLTLKPNKDLRGWYANYIQALIDAIANDTLKRFDRTVVFDSDTWLCEPIDDLYQILDRFDVTSTHAPARQTCAMPDYVPGAFPELNTGVLGFRVDLRVRTLFMRWRDLLLKHFDVWGDNDQGALRMALWRSPVSVWVMPPEYNCRFGFGGFAGSPIKVLHGRGYPFEKAETVVNAQHGMRVWRREDL